MFHCGDYVAYGSAGVCKIIAIGKINFADNPKRVYYTLCPPYIIRDTKIYVPVDACNSMRMAITEEEALSCLNELAQVEVQAMCNVKNNLLETHYHKMLATHDLTEYLRLYKELYQREKICEKAGKKPGQVDVRYQDKVEKLLSEEFAIALHITPGEAKRKLYEAVDPAYAECVGTQDHPSVDRSHG